jgi:hypothetical protein
MDNSTETEEKKGQTVFSMAESCICPEYDRYRVDFNGNVWDIANGRQKAVNNLGIGYRGISTYAFATKTKGHAYVHRMVATCFVENPENDIEVDHIDGDRANNHHTNLRWCTISQQNANKCRRKNSGLPRGVSFSYGAFHVRVWKDGKQHNGGTFSTVEKADQVAKSMRKLFFGEFARDV